MLRNKEDRLVRYLVVMLLLLVGIFYAYPFIVGPKQVIEDVSAFTEGDAIIVQVNFSVPVRYQDHFPAGFGELLQLKFRLITLNKIEKNEVVASDALRPELVKAISLANISYEGNVPGGPFLTFLFTRPVKYKVRQNTSLHSLVVEFPQAKKDRVSLLPRYEHLSPTGS